MLEEQKGRPSPDHIPVTGSEVWQQKDPMQVHQGMPLNGNSNRRTAASFTGLQCLLLIASAQY